MTPNLLIGVQITGNTAIKSPARHAMPAPERPSASPSVAVHSQRLFGIFKITGSLPNVTCCEGLLSSFRTTLTVHFARGAAFTRDTWCGRRCASPQTLKILRAKSKLPSCENPFSRAILNFGERFFREEMRQVRKDVIASHAKSHTSSTKTEAGREIDEVMLLSRHRRIADGRKKRPQAGTRTNAHDERHRGARDEAHANVHRRQAVHRRICAANGGQHEGRNSAPVPRIKRAVVSSSGKTRTLQNPRRPATNNESK